MAAKKQSGDEETAKQIEYFRKIIWKIQEVGGALGTQAALIEILKDILREMPEDSEVMRGLCSMADATENMRGKLEDAESYVSSLCSSITGENILYTVLLDDLKMYAKPGVLHD